MDVDKSWIALYIHLSACDEKQILRIIESFYFQLQKHAHLIDQKESKLIEDIDSMVFLINDESYELPLNDFWQHIKSDNYITKMFWKWIKKMYDLSCHIVQESKTKESNIV